MHKKISLFCKYLHIHRFLYIFRAVINLYIRKPLNRLQPRSLSLPSLFFQCIIYDVPSRSTCTYIFFWGGRTPPPTNKQTTCNIVAHSLSSLNYFCLLPRWLGSPEHSNTITIRIYLQKSVLPVYIYHLQRVMLPFTCQTDGQNPIWFALRPFQAVMDADRTKLDFFVQRAEPSPCISGCAQAPGALQTGECSSILLLNLCSYILISYLFLHLYCVPLCIISGFQVYMCICNP